MAFVLVAGPLCGDALAQAVRESWRNPRLYCTRVALDFQNNVCTDTNGPLLDYYANKYDPRGNLIWTSRYGNPQRHEHSHWLAVDSQGNIILTGHQSAGGMLNVKFGANGGVQWAILDPTSREGYRVEVDAADNIYVASVVFDPRNRNDFVLTKYDPQGNQLWRRQRDFYGNSDSPNAMAVRADGTVAVTGSSTSNMATVVYDTNGNELFFDWRLAAAGGQDVAWGSDGSIYICSGAAPGTKALLVALSPSGTPAWTVEQTGPHGPFGWGRRLAVDSDDNVIVVGHTSSTTAYMDWLIFKTDRDGNVLWTRTYDGLSGNDEFAKGVIVGPDDSIYVAGIGGIAAGVCSFIPGLGEVVRRYDAGGSLLWHNEACSSAAAPTMVIERFGDLVLSGGTGGIVWFQQRDWMTLGSSLAGTGGTPDLDVQGYLDPRRTVSFSVAGALPDTVGVHVLGTWQMNLPIAGGTLVPFPDLMAPFSTDTNGGATASFRLPRLIPIASEFYVQSWLLDPGAPQGLAATDAVVKALQ